MYVPQNQGMGGMYQMAPQQQQQQQPMMIGQAGQVPMSQVYTIFLIALKIHLHIHDL